MKALLSISLAGFLAVIPSVAGKMSAQSRTMEPPQARDQSRMNARLARQVQHQLITIPTYDVFDWLESRIEPDGTVILGGEVTDPLIKSEAESRVRSLEAAKGVVNKIEVLPLSENDNQIRHEIYRALFNINSPLFQYGIRAVPPIHIIVKGGRATLKGTVLNDMDRQLAENTVRQVWDVLEVTNQLKVEKPPTSK
jgi:osmotically-inducible protein OsmY